MYLHVRSLLESLAPHRCAGCGVVAEALCARCVELIERIGSPSPVPLGPGHLHAAFWYEPPLRQLIQAGKYRDHRRALHVASVLASERLHLRSTPGRIVVPVPLGARRRRGRGYNQAEVIALTLAASSGLPAVPVDLGLVRVRETASQVGRHRGARQANVSNAFAWQGGSLHGRSVWLVDDVVTTGATVAAAAGAIRSRGALSVEVLTLARA